MFCVTSAHNRTVKRRVFFLLLPQVHLLDLSGPAQVFDSANGQGAQYELHYLAEQSTVTSAQRLVLQAETDWPELQANDLLLVPGLRARPTPPAASRGIIKKLSNLPEGLEIAAICSGAFVLGQAGLLKGRRCTTHWSLLEELKRQNPLAKVQDGALYVQDGPVTTSAGIASGIDLALSLVEAHHGPQLVAQVARDLVVYLRRDGVQAQTSVYLEYRTHLQRHIHRVQDHLAANLTRTVPLVELATVAHLSERGLSRAFKQATGITPLRYQQLLRLEMARSLLSDPNLNLEQVAASVGFEDARHFRRLWVQEYGFPPSQQRLRHQ